MDRQCHTDYCTSPVSTNGTCDEVGTVDILKQVTKAADINGLWDDTNVHQVVGTVKGNRRKLYIDGSMCQCRRICDV